MDNGRRDIALCEEYKVKQPLYLQKIAEMERMQKEFRRLRREVRQMKEDMPMVDLATALSSPSCSLNHMCDDVLNRIFDFVWPRNPSENDLKKAFRDWRAPSPCDLGRPIFCVNQRLHALPGLKQAFELQREEVWACQLIIK